MHRLPAPAERQRQQRESMLDAIVAVAVGLLEEDGVTGLNMHTVAQRVNLRVQSLYNYFPSRAALYDAVQQYGAELLLAHDRDVWASTLPTWERIATWLQARVVFAREHRALYELITGAQVPEFTPSPETVQALFRVGEAAVDALQELIDAEIVTPPISPQRAINLLLAASRGIVAETLGKEHMDKDPERFTLVVADFIETFQRAWSTERGAL